MDAAAAQTLSHVSRRVLLTAAALAPAGDSEATADVLYHGNWLALTPAWLRRFPDASAAARYVAGDAAEAGTLAGVWLRSQDASWMHWSTTARQRVPCEFKVYVSVLPDALPVAFERCVEVFARHDVGSFKLSRQPRGLLRPDRLVAYCATRAETDALVRALAAALDGVPAHGVPFTASATGSPAVSWARDPPAAVAPYAPSWRRWIARKLAGYLHASDGADGERRAAFARARLEEDGVDTVVWAPRRELWERA